MRILHLSGTIPVNFSMLYFSISLCDSEKTDVFTQMPRDTVWIMECNCNPEFIKLHVNK